MEIRGKRECTECGTRWSYYETGSVTCPNCGSIRSVGTADERTYHTDVASALDLDDARRQAADGTLAEAAEAAASAANEYVRERGFVSGGDLRDLDDAYLTARELGYVASELERALSVDDDEEYYFLALLRGADDGERPDERDVPGSLADVRGLAYATAVGEYRREIRSWLDTRDDEPENARALLETLGDHVKRVQALDGDVSLDTSERVVAAARAVGDYVRSGAEEDAARSRALLDDL
ncbi:TFIIB-type zinc ribbon-containing protein [Salarchaeum sp. JOR-1]|uniref:DUF7117 family protein n=1 Tax=Salarchaeum sp. JOR-1 TaxID=2599399 RepID=UPI0011989B34|nr:TFIIB-type zinc ribbon-containing protein [Salarchaeum sp. JOR-1]QDX41676.1 TFIIB-type zinc ribbon-containing protein [Salarchaeum sp. JOR-1]